jgi:transposase
LTSRVESPSRVKILAFFRWADSVARSIQSGFRGEQGRGKRIALARAGSATCRATRRANARVLLDDGWSCRKVAAALLFDDDTIRGWRNLFEPRGIEGLISFDVGGGAGFPSAAQEDVLKAWLAAKPPRSTRQIGAWIKQEFCGVYESRSGLIAFLHRPSLAYHKPEIIPRKVAEAKQKAFIAAYENRLNSMANDEVVLVMDAGRVQPARAGCWAPSQEKLAILQTSGRRRINIHGAIDLETGQPSEIAPPR